MNAAGSGEHGSRSDAIPVHVGVLVVVLYLVTFHYWQQTVYGQYSFVVQRVIFLALTLPSLSVAFGVRLREMIGALDIPGRADPPLFAASLVLLIALRLAIKILFQHWLPGSDTMLPSAGHLVQECAIPPLNEEPVFRGLLMMCLQPAFRGRGGWLTLLGAVIFASAHPARAFEQQVSTATMGLVLGHLFMKTRSLSSCLLLHAVWNGGVFVELPAL